MAGMLKSIRTKTNQAERSESTSAAWPLDPGMVHSTPWEGLNEFGRQEQARKILPAQAPNPCIPVREAVSTGQPPLGSGDVKSQAIIS